MNSDDYNNKAMAFYENGDYKKAFRLYMKDASNGDSSAMGAMANMYSESVCFPANLQKSIEWEVKEIEQEKNDEWRASSIQNLAITYRFLGDLKAYKYFLEKSLRLGEYDSALDLARLYNVSDKESEKVKQLLVTVLESNKVCQMTEEEAEQLLEKLPSQPANNRLIPECYLQSVENQRLNPQEKKLTTIQSSIVNGRDISKKIINAEYHHAMGDYTKAFQRFNRLVTKWKSPIAMNYLGLMHRQGQGVKQSYDVSIEWYHKAVEQGHEESLIDLANAYRDIRQIDQYKYYLEEACKIGNSKAMLLLAKLYNVSDKETDYVKMFLNAILQSNTATVDIIYEAETLLDSLIK